MSANITCKRCKARCPKDIAQLLHWDFERRLCPGCGPQATRYLLVENDILLAKSVLDGAQMLAEIVEFEIAGMRVTVDGRKP